MKTQETGELLSIKTYKSKYIIGCDLKNDGSEEKIVKIINIFANFIREKADAYLILAYRYNRIVSRSVLNTIEILELSENVGLYPYYDVCRRFPVKKSTCKVWIDDWTADDDISIEFLRHGDLQSKAPSASKALFVTPFHPGKDEGNSVLMRQWLRQLRIAGYQIHVLYYAVDRHSVMSGVTERARADYDLFEECPVESALVGSNRNGLNVHVDDWCGGELLAAVDGLVARHAYDLAVVNYAFLSATFERMPSYVRRFLLTHDSFTDRNRRMLADGYPESGWLSLDRAGEALACARADVIVALQDQDAEFFRALCNDETKVRVVGPIFNNVQRRRQLQAGVLTIGYLGSSNWVNEQNLTTFMEGWANSDTLLRHAQLIVGGGVCRTLSKFAGAKLLQRVQPRLLGDIADLRAFFDACDLFINPERGGTGIKIKTLEAMAHGVPVLATRAGFVGIESSSRFHSATSIAELAQLAGEIVANASRLHEVAAVTNAAHEGYVTRHQGALRDLLELDNKQQRPWRRLRARSHQTPQTPSIVPDYVRDSAAAYHLEEFDRIRARVTLTGKRVLEIGGDHHAAMARLFIANGATEVVCTNAANWTGGAPLPEGIHRLVGDVADLAETVLKPGSFDIIFGIAVLEQVRDLDRIAAALNRLLRPGGVAYLQGCPLWPSSLGHHACIDAAALPVPNGVAASDVGCSVADDKKKPLSRWAHHTPAVTELSALPTPRGIPAEHTEAISDSICDCEGSHVGVASSLESVSQIIAASGLVVELIEQADVDTSCHQEALKTCSENDLKALSVRLFLTKTDKIGATVDDEAPTVSIIVPCYQVEAYIERCLDSITTQYFDDFEVIIVDDASRDGSRRIAERFAVEDDRIRIVTHATNRGLGPARNTGVLHARGAYLFFLDSDDLLAGPDVLDTLVAAVRRTGSQVVVGSCEALLPNGRVEPFDRQHDERAGGQPGTMRQGLEAFIAGMYVPNGGYLPSRAWGTVIDRAFYQNLGLLFPACEHEDLLFVPMLYFASNSVYYEPRTAVLYRQRHQGLSRSVWTEEKVLRQQTLWRESRADLDRLGLTAQRGNAALKIAEHLVWKLYANGFAAGAEGALIQTLEMLFRDSGGATNQHLVARILDQLSTLPFLNNEWTATLSRLIALLPVPMLITYYRQQLEARGKCNLSARPSPAPLPIATRTTPTPTAAVTASESAIQANEAKVNSIIADYDVLASEKSKNFPSMLTYADKAAYFHAAKNFEFRGSIVDGGCFIGGTTQNLVDGLMHNPLFGDRGDQAKKLIRVYDLFEIDSDYIREHLKRIYPKRDFTGQKSFESIFRENHATNGDLLDVRPGDVIAVGYPDEQPIELLGVDFCKSLPVTDAVVRVFFPRLLPGALILQQDFVHEFHPHIHLSMLRLEPFFSRYAEFKWGGTVAFKLRRPITRSAIHEAFGADGSWYRDVEINARLLRKLIDTSLYDENRWVYLLTLGIYFAQTGNGGMARDVYREALSRFPQFEISNITRATMGC